jgi:hypothetical protein
VTLENLDVTASLLGADAALPEAPSFAVSADDASRLVNGQTIAAPGLHASAVRVYDPSGHLLCIAHADGHALHPRIML